MVCEHMPKPPSVVARSVGRPRPGIDLDTVVAKALAKHPKVFSTLYVNLVAAGEVGGALDSILDRLAIYLEKAEKLKQTSSEKTPSPGPAVQVAAEPKE